MKVKALVFCLAVCVVVVEAASASDGTLSWAYQATGFATQTSTPIQTSLAIRDGKTWPVIFSADASNFVNAYSLYPVLNTTITPSSYWHRIGAGVLYAPSGNSVLSAATSSDGRVAAVVRAFNSSSTTGACVVGSSSTGFGSGTDGVLAIDFNASGSLVKGTANTIPTTFSPGSLVDIAVAPSGEVGAIDSKGYYYQKLGATGNWGKVGYNTDNPSNNCLADLSMDTLGRPHIVSTAFGNSVVAYDFDTIAGQWKPQLLGTSTTNIFTATVAADSQGGVGAAWVQFGTSGATLMYAHKKGIEDWAISPVTSSVYNSLTSSYDIVHENPQRVGLAFDANDFPVISFVGGTGGIYLAYDPPVPTPEPSSIVLLTIAGLFLLTPAGRARLRRLGGK